MQYLEPITRNSHFLVGVESLFDKEFVHCFRCLFMCSPPQISHPESCHFLQQLLIFSSHAKPGYDTKPFIPFLYTLYGSCCYCPGQYLLLLPFPSFPSPTPGVLSVKLLNLRRFSSNDKSFLIPPCRSSHSIFRVQCLYLITVFAGVQFSHSTVSPLKSCNLSCSCLC